MGKRKAKTVTATLPLETMATIAAELHPLHRALTADGYILSSKCRLWRRRDQSWTVRIVYQMPDEPGTTITAIFRGVVFS